MSKQSYLLTYLHSLIEKNHGSALYHLLPFIFPFSTSGQRKVTTHCGSGINWFTACVILTLLGLLFWMWNLPNPLNITSSPDARVDVMSFGGVSVDCADWDLFREVVLHMVVLICDFVRVMQGLLTSLETLTGHP